MNSCMFSSAVWSRSLLPFLGIVIFILSIIISTYLSALVSMNFNEVFISLSFKYSAMYFQFTKVIDDGFVPGCRTSFVVKMMDAFWGFQGKMTNYLDFFIYLFIFFGVNLCINSRHKDALTFPPPRLSWWWSDPNGPTQ